MKWRIDKTDGSPAFMLWRRRWGFWRYVAGSEELEPLLVHVLARRSVLVCRVGQMDGHRRSRR